ncbi:ADP-ribosyltransferase, partial [Pseudomonas aeruginosa]|nr:ADP-ribosyltransferase [Pseudomonas aeruginosa]
LTPEGLAREHSRLASGDWALRSLSTALAGIRAGSQVEESRIQAGRLLERSIGGIALQQWGTTGGAASQLVLDASPELRREITDQLHQVMSEVAL